MFRHPKKPNSDVAKVTYGRSDFIVTTPGNHVICAVSGKHITITDLKYWSHKKQRPYYGAREAFLDDDQ